MRTQTVRTSESNGNSSSWKTSGIVALFLNIGDTGSRQVQRLGLFPCHKMEINDYDINVIKCHQ